MTDSFSSFFGYPIKETIYWNWDKQCPQIFIDAVCKNEGLPGAKAGWGFKTSSGTKFKFLCIIRK